MSTKKEVYIQAYFGYRAYVVVGSHKGYVDVVHTRLGQRYALKVARPARCDLAACSTVGSA